MALNGVSLIEINDRTVESVWKKDCAEYWLKKSRKAWIGALAVAI